MNLPYFIITARAVLGHICGTKMGIASINIEKTHLLLRLKIYNITRLKKLALDAPVSRYLNKGQLVQGGEQYLHVWQERLETAIAVIAQSRVQAAVETRFLFG